MHEQPTSIPRWAKLGFTFLILALGFVIGAWLRTSLGGDETVRSVANAPGAPHPSPPLRSGARTDAKRLPPASAGLNHPRSARHSTMGNHHGNVETSFASLEGALNGTGVGVAIAPLSAGTAPQSFGSLQIGHAWSTLKVPILVTVMREGPLSSEEETWARSALTASDNEAAAALFRQLESSRGGLTGASRAVQETLAAGGDPSTQVATAPPPAGAVSRWGQTEWSLTGAVDFYRSLVCGRLLNDSQTAYVLGLMTEVIPEQQWGLGQAGLSSASYKAGWGPEAASGGAYLVRQSGIIRSESSAAVVAMMVEDPSGSFEASVHDIDQVADWVAEHLHELGGGTC